MSLELTELHRDLLAAAERNQAYRLAHPDAPNHPTDLFDHEALHEVYGFPYQEGGWLHKAPNPRTEPGKPFFSLKAIGEDRYQTILDAALAAFAELEEMGLAKRGYGTNPDWTGITLTPEGVQALKDTAKQRHNVLGDL